MQAERLCVFLQDLSGGGAERMILRVAGGLADLGHPVDLVLARVEGPLAAEVPIGVRVVDLGGRRTMAAVPALGRHLDRERPAALLAALTHVNVAAAAATLLTRRRPRLVLSERNTYSRDRAATRQRTVRLAYALAPPAYRLADAIVAVSAGVADDLAASAGLPRSRISVINNPVVTPATATAAARPVDHPFLAPGHAEPTIVAAGRLTPQKGFDVLLDAFAALRATTPARLVILGEGGERAALERRAEALGVADAVSLPGFVAEPLPYMARADLFVLSSRYEGSPNVLVEAMACGTPVVATDCPSGPRETLQDGALGPLVPVGDAAAFADAMRRTLARPVPAEALRRRAADFTLEAAARAYRDVLLGRAASAPAQAA